MLTRITAPKSAIQIRDIKDDLRLKHSEDDRLIERLNKRATDYLDGHAGILGRAIMRQQWKQTFPAFRSKMYLDLDPLISIDSIEYYDEDEQLQTLASDVFMSYQHRPRPYLTVAQHKTIPPTYRRDDAVHITFTCGFGDREDVPEPIKAAISLLVGYFYENTEAASLERTHPIAMGVDDMIAPFRNYR